MGNENRIYFHADDYGVSASQSARILACYTEGALNSMSVIPNTPQLEASLALLDKEDAGRELRRVMHLNFVEGRPAADVGQVDMLVDETGYFCISFIKLFLWSYTKRGEERSRLKGQLKTEIAAQLYQVTKRCDYKITAIDSHQHYHMIPLVLESLLEVLEEQEFTVREIRVPVDPVKPLLATPSLWLRVPAMNWIKWGILRLQAGKSRRLLEAKGISIPVFFGIFFTCEMKQDIVKALMPKYIAYARKRRRCLELMFHPGNLTQKEELLDMRSKELEAFYMSANRFEEAECLKQLRRSVM